MRSILHEVEVPPCPVSIPPFNKELRIQINGINEQNAAAILEDIRLFASTHPRMRFMFSCLEEKHE